MRQELRLTDIGEGLEEAEVISWLVNVGDTVERDQPVVEVMTDKSNAELPAPGAGTVVELGAAVGEMIHVGALLAIIETEPGNAVSPENGRTSPPEAIPAPAPVRQVPPEAAPPTRRPKAAPSTRRAAAERGVDLSTITGSGPGGRILMADLEGRGPETATPAKAAPAPAIATPVSPPLPVATPQPSDENDQGVQPLRGVRRAVAKSMAQSWSEIPHIHAFEHIDVEPLLELRARMKATGRPEYAGLTPLAFFVAAVARALQAFPQANASIDMAAGTITYHPHVNIGLAVAAPQGLVVPVLHHVDPQDFAKLSSSVGSLVHAARQGALAPEHFRGGTATISNFGSLGGEQATPLIRPPEAVIIGFGSIAPRPIVQDDLVVARKTMHLVIGADHRLLDGDIATGLLNHIGESLTNPLNVVL